MGIIGKKFKKAADKLALMEALDKLKKDLQKLGPVPSGKDVYNYGVKFFNIIASFQDNNAVDVDLFKDSAEEAGILAKHIHNAGRDEYGWVRAQRGETVTLNNLYLGNIHGLPTKTAGFWKEQPEKDVQAIIQGQLSSFIKSHREPMIDLISNVLDNNKKPGNFVVKKIYKKKMEENNR